LEFIQAFNTDSYKVGVIAFESSLFKESVAEGNCDSSD